MMTVGTKIIWIGNNNKDITISEIKEGTITKVGRDTYYVDNYHKAEDQIYAAYCFPDLEETRQLLGSSIQNTLEQKQWGKNYMKSLYTLRNKLITEGKL